jgi:phenylalanyl-tRNA synthetase beta chain
MRLDALVRDLPPWGFDPPSSYPPAIFDLAFEVDEAVSAADLLGAVDTAAGDVLERRDVFDVFTGDPIPPGRKSLALRLTLRAPDRTLTDEEVAPIRRDIVERVTAVTGASLRGEV